MEDILLYFALKYHGDFSLIYDALMNNEKVYEQDKEACKKKVHCKYTTVASKDYPESLKNHYYPPFVIFYQGDLNLMDQHAAINFRCTNESNRLYYNTQGFLGVENYMDLMHA